MAKHATLAPSQITARNDEFPQFDLGGFYYNPQTGKTYRYVKFDNGSAVASAANGVATWKDASAFTVTSDLSDGLGQNFPAGIFQGVVTDLYYTFIQVGGVATVTTDGGDDIAAGDAVIVDASVDLACDSVAAATAPTHRVIGFAVAADVDGSNTVDTLLALDL